MVDLLAREVPAALEDYGTGTFTEHSLADIRVEERKGEVGIFFYNLR